MPHIDIKEEKTWQLEGRQIKRLALLGASMGAALASVLITYIVVVEATFPAS